MLNDYFLVQLHQSIEVALSLDSTKEVISIAYGDVCPIPGVSPALLGVVNQRGKLLWVFDLGDLVKISPSQKPLRPQDNLTLLVLNTPSKSNAQVQDRQVGCLVSALKGVVTLDSADFQPLNNQFPNLKSFSSAIALLEKQTVAVIDTQAILDRINSISFNLVNSL